MPSQDLDQLRRWVSAGGTWQVVHSAEDRVTVALLTCSGGEEMARIRIEQSDLIVYLQRDLT